MIKNDDYKKFLESKIIKNTSEGFDISLDDISDVLFQFQKDIVKTSIKKGRFAIFASCGLGKTLMQLEWAKHIYKYTGKNILIVAPLAVTSQTKKEGDKLNVKVNICRKQSDVKDGINITNYEMLEHFTAKEFIAVVLDESSILKNFSGKIKQNIINMFNNTPYKLCCTATPSPNDYEEMGNHSEFLNCLSRVEMLSMFFYHDGSDTAKWSIKRHGIKDFWKWVSSWAVSIDKPSDFGYEDNGFKLPELIIKEEVVSVDFYKSAGDMLFRIPSLSASDYHKEKRLTVEDRAIKTKEIINTLDGQVCIWCDTNYESDALKKILPEAVEVRGDNTIDFKEQTALDFAAGKIRLLISKPSIFGFGLNFQSCHNVIFCGMSYSYEMYYQATRRFWRFGQKHAVTVHIVIGETEKHILDVIKEKEGKYMELKDNMQNAMNQVQDLSKENKYAFELKHKIVQNSHYKMILGDCIEEIKNIKTESIYFTIFSPPFASLYTYSNSIQDLGNSSDYNKFFEHFDFLVPELLRITKPGRLLSFHCMDIPIMKERDGYIGLRNFSGDLINAFMKHGWIYHSRHTIWKDPLIEATRTKALGLQHKQLVKDSSMARAGLPDYLITFRKDGENKELISHGSGLERFIGEGDITASKSEIAKTNLYSQHIWRKYASPVWMDINQSRTLNKTDAREDDDEKHICPLQLDVIERAIELWSNPSDTIFSPFAGIGSEGYVSIINGRKFVGIELKESYYNQAIINLNDAIHKSNIPSLFDNIEEPQEIFT